jgi:hypothetical protein
VLEGEITYLAHDFLKVAERVIDACCCLRASAAHGLQCKACLERVGYHTIQHAGGVQNLQAVISGTL